MAQHMTVTGCFSRGPEFKFQHPHSDSTVGSNGLSSGVQAYTHTEHSFMNFKFDGTDEFYVKLLGYILAKNFFELWKNG